MNGSQFKAWRESHGLTQQQIADRIKMTRTTIQNWEASQKEIPQIANMAFESLGARLKQENPSLGPLTLVYSDGPMFINPYGPRRRPAMMQQEPYPSNARAIARVQEMWGREDFHNPFILQDDGAPIWNSAELSRVVDGSDIGAPTLNNLLRKSAQYIWTYSSFFARVGPKTWTPTERATRVLAIEAQAAELDQIAGYGLQAAISSQSKIEGVLQKLRDLSRPLPEAHVAAIYDALPLVGTSQPRLPEPRTDGPNCIIDYKGFEISYLRVPLTTGPLSISIGSNSAQLLSRFRRDQRLFMTHDLQAGIKLAKQLIDAVVR